MPGDSSMNEQDKILLSSYLDNAISDEEIEYVEKLVDEDQDALNYLNNLKALNNRVNSYIEDSLNSKEAKEFGVFMDNLAEERENPLIKGLKKFLFPQAILGYALSGLLFFNIGSIQYAGNSPEENFLAEFSYGEPIVNSYLKYRGLDQDNNEAEKYIKETLDQMVNQKVALAEINHGSQPYSIEIKEKSLNKNSFDCYEGSVVSGQTTQTFLFCKSEDSSSLILN